MTDQSAPALKEIFNVERLQHIATEMTAVYPAFDAKGFLKHAKAGLSELSVMQRMARVSESLHAVIPLDYPQTLTLLYALAPRLNSEGEQALHRALEIIEGSPGVPAALRRIFSVIRRISGVLAYPSLSTAVVSKP